MMNSTENRTKSNTIGNHSVPQLCMVAFTISNSYREDSLHHEEVHLMRNSVWLANADHKYERSVKYVQIYQLEKTHGTNKTTHKWKFTEDKKGRKI